MEKLNPSGKADIRLTRHMIDGGLHPIRTIKGFEEFVRIIDILEY